MTLNIWEIGKNLLASAVAIAILGDAAKYGIRSIKKIHPYVIQSAADYSEAIEIAVRLAEKSGAPGSTKIIIALDQMQAWFDEEAIAGRASDVTPERIKTDIERAVARLFPSKPKG